MQIYAIALRMIFISLLAAGFLLNGCSDKGKGGPPPPTEVSVVTIQAKSVATTTELPGRTSAHLVAEVRPQVAGIIQKRLFSEGANVRAGQVLFQIDSSLYQAALDNAKASLARSEAQLSTIQLKAARLKELLAEKAVSQQDYDDAAAALKQTQADIQFGKATVEAARINLQHTAIGAPISGRIGRSSVTEGALVTTHQPQPMATIQELDPMYVDVTQSTAEILRLRRQLQEGRIEHSMKHLDGVRLLLEDGSEYPWKGVLQFQDVTVDPTTGSVVLRMVFPNPKGILLPGMFVRTVIQEGIRKNAILVPQQAVSRDLKGNPFAFVVDSKGIVQQRPLTLDRTVGDAWLATSGLESGERVIVEGILKVKPGAPVRAVSFKPSAKTNGKGQNPAPPDQTR
ncbi:MAG: efflux RND transporter periplasmic adaptor subunit [Smithellaceae bacterium]|jgi:membrane fusion protein, multidrug efflux system|nr:efflux RND transporter periplasmic adaptor subunit [Smithellaceae bacterium]MDD3258545.1 efflux RND transporter periplasmic adaptor subunit [Smithellaceae bacterium]MDD3849495.1 efflux RND transporter periplasmic adaptor subunit [Smithellaceae bacterium]HOG12316.1 efflux RND transporter periplasmic adaptor subunit [Smithellaceae bacterium]HOQ71866.1 efflux RND transporter periplasmic adaptor subunit [Smithellaceae bacterium]